MTFQSLISTIILATFATRAAVLDQEPPVFTYCPSDITIDNATTYELRVYWQEPTATDNSGVMPSVSSVRRSGDLFAVPSLSEVLYIAKDESGNEATCSFRVTLKRETCPLYAAPENGALACNRVGSDYVCAVMCKNGFDFVSNPPLLYFCSATQWQTFISFPTYPYSPQLPWPACSNSTNLSYLKEAAEAGQLEFSYFFFDGDANDPDVQAVIKTNFLSFMKSSMVPPFFCLFQPADCNEDSVEVYAGSSV